MHSTKTQIQKVTCTQKPVLNVLFKDFCYPKINPVLISNNLVLQIQLISIKG